MLETSNNINEQQHQLKKRKEHIQTMPLVATVCTDLIIPSSPPQPLRKGISSASSSEEEDFDTDNNNKKNLFLIPIELLNGCSETNCTIVSDNLHLTNLLRRYYLEHFGHRNLDGIMQDYTNDAILVCVINGQRTSYHGRNEIRTKFFQDVFFKLHPTINSTFELKHIEITSHNNGCVVGVGVGGDGSSNHHDHPHPHDPTEGEKQNNRNNRNCSTGMGIWSARTPTNIFPQSTDTFLFDHSGTKIMKHFFTCTIDHLENTPWYLEE